MDGTQLTVQLTHTQGPERCRNLICRETAELAIYLQTTRDACVSPKDRALKKECSMRVMAGSIRQTWWMLLTYPNTMYI
jgi:hypothetical protein